MTERIRIPVGIKAEILRAAEELGLEDPGAVISLLVTTYLPSLLSVVGPNRDSSVQDLPKPIKSSTEISTAVPNRDSSVSQDSKNVIDGFLNMDVDFND